MTVLVAWVRTLFDGTEELVVASDSRLRSGGNLDCAPKVLTLPRSDAVIAFAGTGYFGYPLVLQLNNAIHAHSPLRDRGMDYHKMRDHALTIFNTLIATFEGVAREAETHDTSFLMAGYSWREKSFAIDQITWRAGEERFAHRPSARGIGNFGKFSFAGDMGREAFRRLTEMLSERHGVEAVSSTSTLETKFNMEPFEVLRDMLRESDVNSTIGGPPQVVRLSQAMNAMPTAVYWPDKQTGQVYLAGRPLMTYENIDSWLLDPDSFALTNPRALSAQDRALGGD